MKTNEFKEGEYYHITHGEEYTDWDAIIFVEHIKDSDTFLGIRYPLNKNKRSFILGPDHQLHCSKMESLRPATIDEINLIRSHFNLPLFGEEIELEPISEELKYTKLNKFLEHEL